MNQHTNPNRATPARAQAGRRVRGLVLAAGLLLASGLAGCGRGPSLDATPPSTIGPLQQMTILRAAEAVEAVENTFAITARASDAWISTYGDGDRIEIYALGMSDEAATEPVVSALRSMTGREGSPYRASATLTVAQQEGYRADGDGKVLFFYARGRWVVLIRAMAADLDPAVVSINWVRPA